MVNTSPVLRKKEGKIGRQMWMGNAMSLPRERTQTVPSRTASDGTPVPLCSSSLAATTSPLSVPPAPVEGSGKIVILVIYYRNNHFYWSAFCINLLMVKKY